MCFHRHNYCVLYWAPTLLSVSESGLCVGLQAIWSTSPSWSRGACWRCWLTSTSGPVKKPSASATSYSPCWSWSLRKEPRPQSACATLGSPSSGDLQLLHLPSLLLSPETATDHFPVWAYQMNIYFSICFVIFFGFLMFLLLSACFSVCLLCICWFFPLCDDVRNPVGYITLWSCWLQLLFSVHPPN